MVITAHKSAVAILLCAWLGACYAPAQAASPSTANGLPVRGLHLSGPAKREVPALLQFIGETLPKEGINTLILEINYGFNYQSRPELSNPSGLGKEEVQQIAKACREKHVELIPQINCLGHQSWDQRTDRLLEKHPEFDETPGKYPQNKGIYCRSYCPLHPQVHAVVFDLMDELAKACDAKSFHIGMDEVFILADPDCPRCKGKAAAELFADEVKTLHDHLQQIGCRMWMWGDRFLDGKATRIGEWEASQNGTEAAIDLVSKDIVICDWHYERAHETAQTFAKKGFGVVECPWRKPAVALGQLAQVRALRADPDKAVAERALGMVHTTWCGFTPFLKAYQAQTAGEPPSKNAAGETAQCFRELCQAMRKP